jgi:hypothetical protein
MISIRPSGTAMAVSIVFFAVAFVGAPGCVNAQPSTHLNLKSGDSALPEESNAVVGGRESMADQYFHLDWSVAPGRAGMSRITGYVYNDYGEAAQDIELKITALDTAGQPVATVFKNVSDTVPARGREYFDIQVPSSQSYKVDVEAFDFTVGTGGN